MENSGRKCDLLFSFECCLGVSRSASASFQDPRSCYFLLNAVRQPLNTDTSTPEQIILLFSFECCFRMSMSGLVKITPAQTCYFLLNAVRIEEAERTRRKAALLAIFFWMLSYVGVVVLQHSLCIVVLLFSFECCLRCEVEGACWRGSIRWTCYFLLNAVRRLCTIHDRWRWRTRWSTLLFSFECCHIA